MSWKLEWDARALKDIKKLKLNKHQILKLKQKAEAVAENPLPKTEGGLGEALSGNLKGFLKFRFDNDYRVAYQLIITDTVMRILVIGLRSDKEIYHELSKRGRENEQGI